MQNFLPGLIDKTSGLKTNINTVLLSVISIAQVLGVTIDPAATAALFEQWWGILVAVNGGLAATGIWFRQLANK